MPKSVVPETASNDSDNNTKDVDYLSDGDEERGKWFLNGLTPRDRVGHSNTEPIWMAYEVRNSYTLLE